VRYFSGIDAAFGIFEKSSFSIRPSLPPRRQFDAGVSTTSQIGLPAAACALMAGYASGTLS
jgi:hypothetical protein